ncbi:MAG: tRNA (adenosine(37)-N6)-threonylcarbamoyltransferase complex dimerization subunit type 1 TsaB [Lacibacter sp.]
MALLLNIDTAGEQAFVALAENGTILAQRRCTTQKQHAAFVQPAIEEIIKETARPLQQVDGVAVTIGPGSYTGLRVGLASAKGLCYALNKPLITIGTLAVWAQAGRDVLQQQARQARHIIPLIDARRMEVFAAVYDTEGNEVQPPHAHILHTDSYAAELASGPVLFLGSGAAKWQPHCTHANALFSTEMYQALHMSTLAEQGWQQQQFASLAYAAPLYVKPFYTTAGNG